MPNKLLHIQNITKQYRLKTQTIKALNNITLEIHSGEVVGLLGANGAGKTTLSSIIATLHPPTAGDILYDNTSIYKDITGFRRIVGYCPQKPNLNPLLTVRQNLLYAGRYYGIPEKQVQRRLEELLAKYNLNKYADEEPGVLSGGYKQRVIIARALMHEPKLVIFDEPTVGLDPHIRHQLWENIRDLKKDGISVILTTHYIDEAEILSDRICILDKGSIRLIDTPDNLMTVYEKSTLEDVFLQLMHEESCHGEKL